MAILIFDLDGTLINTASIVVDAYHRVLTDFSYDKAALPNEEQVLKTFGLPDTEIWRQLMPKHTPAQQMNGFEQASGRIQKDMAVQDILLPHAKEVLIELHARGHVLTTGSNCNQAYLDVVMTTQGIGHLFDRPLCLESVSGQEKADILRTLKARYEPDGDLYMIGDRYTDAEAARKVHIPFVACDFGFGDPSELAGATHKIQSLPELLALFQ
ncbi:HAD family hydrolase [Alicyclobacillus fodiniaquatilis]|uniref:HAD family hydrolase n=1 Tax=Alicyclobacillus fodiniaquatilis TaxID=1661150 RepID=A0ABW4JH94_9BACL